MRAAYRLTGRLHGSVESLDAEGLREELVDCFSYSSATFPRVTHSLWSLCNSCAHHDQRWRHNPATHYPRLNKRERPRGTRFHEHGQYPAGLALKKLAWNASSRSPLSVIGRRLRNGSLHSPGLLGVSRGPLTMAWQCRVNLYPLICDPVLKASRDPLWDKASGKS